MRKVFIFVIIILIILFFLSIFIKKEEKIVEKKQEIKIEEEIEIGDKEEKIERKIDGVLVKKGEENLYPIAIITENMIEGRPQSGLEKAILVYEAITEAGITRFLAIFATNEEIKEIGPIRSARKYFLDWAEEYKALFVHSGGSPDSLRALKEREYYLYDFNEFFNEKYFFRKEKKAPHNLYTSSDLLKKALEIKNTPKEGDFESFLFKDDLKLEERGEVNNFTIDFSLPEYRVEWKYDKEKNYYLRYQAGEKHLTKDEKEIRAKNIIIQEVETDIVDEEGRKEMRTIGKGKAIVFQDGKIILANWQKIKKGEKTKFLSPEGEEIKFNQGTTWIEIVPSLKIVSY